MLNILSVDLFIVYIILILILNGRSINGGIINIESIILLLDWYLDLNTSSTYLP